MKKQPTKRFSVIYKKTVPVYGWNSSEIVGYSSRTQRRRMTAPDLETAREKLTSLVTRDHLHPDEVTVEIIKAWQYVPGIDSPQPWENWKLVYSQPQEETQ